MNGIAIVFNLAVLASYAGLAYLLWRVGNYFRRMMHEIRLCRQAVELTEPGRVRITPPRPGQLVRASDFAVAPPSGWPDPSGEWVWPPPHPRHATSPPGEPR